MGTWGQGRKSHHHSLQRLWALEIRGLGAGTWGLLGARDKVESHITIHKTAITK